MLTYQLFAYGIIILNFLGLFLYYNVNSKTLNILPLFGAFTGITIADIYQYRKQKKTKSLGIVILILGFLWSTHGYYYLLFLNLLLWALYTISRRRLVIEVNDRDIYYPTFPKKIIFWGDANNVILKDDIITIDLKNNKIYQHEIEYMDKPVNEAEFNDFCKLRLIG